MEYHFNYQLLGEFLRSNPNLNKTDIMRAIKTKDYASINRYIDGKITPPIEHLLRISNTFGIPLSAWFFDMEADRRDQHFGSPLSMEYTKPTDGWSDGHEHGGRKHLSPVVEEKVAAVIPVMATTKVMTFLDRKTEEVMTDDITALQDEVARLHLGHERELAHERGLHEQDLVSEKKRHKKALKEAADRHAAERLTLVDIVKSQQETIASQEETIAQLLGEVRRLLGMVDGQGVVGMAAEGIERH